MERVVSEAFITIPAFRSQQTSEIQQKLPNELRQKIINILKTFTQKQLLFQAVNNIGIPKNFVEISYIQSRPENQLHKIYSTISALKKEVLRIKKHSDPSQAVNNLISIQSHKFISECTNRNIEKKEKDPIFMFLKKQIEPEAKIKQAIQKQLEYRQKLDKLDKKTGSAEKIKLEFLQKRKQTAKNLNKKAIEVYQKQKQTQQKWFQKIIQSNIEMQNKQNTILTVNRGFNTANSTKRLQNHELVKERLQRQKIQFQSHLQEQVIQRMQRQSSVKQFKHRRLNSLNDRVQFNKMKSLEIRQRKISTVQQQEVERLKKIIEKEKKFLSNRHNKNINDHSSIQSSRGQNTILITNQNLLRNNDIYLLNLEKYDEKENMIFNKIAKKNQNRQLLLNEKVQKMKVKHKLQESKREAFKQSQIKLLTENYDSNESYIYQKDIFGSKSSAFSQIEGLLANVQEQNIRRKHQNALKNISCDQSIMRLRKLPKAILEKKLKDIKNNELSDILAQNIVKLLN